MTVDIFGANYEIEYGLYNDNDNEYKCYKSGPIYAYVDFPNKKIVIHALNMEDFITHEALVEEAIWFVLLSAFRLTYEKAFDSCSGISRALSLFVGNISARMPLLLQIFDSIKADISDRVIKKEEKALLNIALLKQIPKAPNSIEHTYSKRTRIAIGSCNTCGYQVASYMEYCPNCGQRIDWGNE